MGDEGLLLRSRHSYQQDSQSFKRDVFSFLSDDVEGLPISALWNALDALDIEKHNDFSTSARVRKRLADMFSLLFGHALTDSFGSPDFLGKLDFGCFDLFGADVMFDADL